MSLTSLTFLGIYFPVLLIAYYNPVFRSSTARKIILLLASIGLYTFCKPVYSLLLIGVILINFILVKMSEKFSTDVFRALAIAIDAGTLLFYKYINKVLVMTTGNNDISKIVFPIGLSYFTFKAISYVVDSKKQKDGTLVDAAIYIANFLTIVSGPLSTYQDELPMIRKGNEVSLERTYKGIERLIIGFGKKVIIADNLSYLVTQAYASSDLSCVLAWAGAVAYTLQLFFDFSGYTDMAIGIGTLFGFDLPENFNYPYMASSISDFWKRWHMSLTKWFTRYIYIPLGGSRVKSSVRHIFNLLVVWVVTGIWHGSSITFLVWAMIYFVLQALEKYTSLTKVLDRLHIGHIYTMLVVIIEWVIFKSESIGAGWNYIRSMFMLNGNMFIKEYDLQSISRYTIPLVLAILFSTNVGVKLKEKVSRNSGLNVMYKVALFGIYLICIIITIGQGYTSPLYAGF